MTIKAGQRAALVYLVCVSLLHFYLNYITLNSKTLKKLVNSPVRLSYSWTPAEEKLVMSFITNRNKNKPLSNALAMAARSTRRTKSAVTVRYYTNIRPLMYQSFKTVKVTKNSAIDTKVNKQMVRFVKALFLRLTAAERVKILKSYKM